MPGTAALTWKEPKRNSKKKTKTDNRNNGRGASAATNLRDDAEGKRIDGSATANATATAATVSAAARGDSQTKGSRQHCHAIRTASSGVLLGNDERTNCGRSSSGGSSEHDTTDKRPPQSTESAQVVEEVGRDEHDDPRNARGLCVLQ